MATMPPEMTAPMGEMPAAPEAEAKVVCIAMSPDGMFSVYMKDEEPMPGMEPGAEPEGQQATSMDEALDMARTMLQDDGQSPEDQMMAGYNKGAPAAKPTPAKVFGE